MKLSEEQLKEALGDLSATDCLHGFKQEIKDARRELAKYNNLTVRKRMEFVYKKSQLQSIQIKLSHTGIFITNVLIILLMDCMTRSIPPDPADAGNSHAQTL